MSVYRRKDSRFYSFDFQIDGYRFSGTTKTDNERDAQTFEDAERIKAQALVDSFTATATGPMTIAVATKRWWNEHGKFLNDPDLKRACKWLAGQLGPKTLLHVISNDDVSKMVAARRKHVTRAGRDENGKQLYRPITARTVNKTTVSLLRRVMHRARDNWDVLIPREPTWTEHWLKQTKRPIREITRAEDALLDDIEDADYRALRRFAEITGLRRRNLLLTWPQVDFELAIIRVISKGGVPRIVPLSREAYEILWARRGQHPTQVFTFVAQRTRKCGKTGRDYVKGERYPISYYGMGSSKRRNWKKAGVNARIHDMRHTAGSRTLRRSGNLKAVQLLLGHSTIAVTSEFYANVLVDDVRAAMETTAEAERAAAPPAPKIARDEGS